MVKQHVALVATRHAATEARQYAVQFEKQHAALVAKRYIALAAQKHAALAEYVASDVRVDSAEKAAVLNRVSPSVQHQANSVVPHQ